MSKLAKDSNRAAKNWAVKPKPNNDKQYQAWINSSPWCSWADGNAGNHKLILHHSSSGATQSIEIHKLGAQEWIKDNLSKLSRICSILVTGLRENLSTLMVIIAM